MKKTKCPACGKTAFQPATYAARRDLDGRRFTADVPSRKCTSCAELLISGPGLRAFDRAITLERMLTRDGCSFAEAMQTLTTAGWNRAEIDAIYVRLPSRAPRPILVAEDSLPEPAATDTDDDGPA